MIEDCCDQIRNSAGLVLAKIARRGSATAPEVEVAATEEVARRLASGMR
jgi:hypothetical protein